MLENKDHTLQDIVEGEEKSETTESKQESEKSTEPEDKSPDVITADNTETVKEDVHEEINESNAEDAEDKDNHRRHHIPIPDYHAMSMENLVGELQRLVRNEKVQAIKKHVDGIKYEFDLKFLDFLEHKKEDFIAKGVTKLTSDIILLLNGNSTRSILNTVIKEIPTIKVLSKI
jgi:hypothetical protein